MYHMSMSDSFFQPIQDAAASVLGGITSLVGNENQGLSEPPSDGAILLPNDLFAQAGAETEWWYYTGHCKTDAGREFGFELVFFKRRTDRDIVGGLPMAAVANPMYFAHFAVSDITRGIFHYSQKRSFDKPFDTPVRMSTTTCDIDLGGWTIREVVGNHVLHAQLDDGLTFDAILKSEKPAVPNGENGSGLSIKQGGASKHFSFTRMSVTGQLSGEDRTEIFTGSAWMDREYGAWGNAGGWDWFSIQLDDNTELMLYQFSDATGTNKGNSTGTFVRENGEAEYLARSEFEITPTAEWKSPHSGAGYPAGWQISVPRLGISVDVQPLIADQELDTRGTTVIIYWEGACSVSGKREGSDVRGKAYVELVGYDRSHENVGFTGFLFGGLMR
jgi:predicted secreted hydrolase